MKTMVVTNKGHKEINLTIDNHRTEVVPNFQYLRIWINENLKNDVDVRAGIAKAKKSFWRHRGLMNNNLSLNTKKKLLDTEVQSTLWHGRETFVLMMSLRKKITAFVQWCYRRILKISWTKKNTNKEVMWSKNEILWSYC